MHLIGWADTFNSNTMYLPFEFDSAQDQVMFIQILTILFSAVSNSIVATRGSVQSACWDRQRRDYSEDLRYLHFKEACKNKFTTFRMFFWIFYREFWTDTHLTNENPFQNVFFVIENCIGLARIGSNHDDQTFLIFLGTGGQPFQQRSQKRRRRGVHAVRSWGRGTYLHWYQLEIRHWKGTKSPTCERSTENCDEYWWRPKYKEIGEVSHLRTSEIEEVNTRVNLLYTSYWKMMNVQLWHCPPKVSNSIT